MARTDRTGQQYPTFALLATLSAAPFSPPQGGDAAVGAIFPAVAPEKSDQPGVLGNLPRARGEEGSEMRGASGAPAGKTPGAKPATSRSGAATERKAAAARKRAAA